MFNSPVTKNNRPSIDNQVSNKFCTKVTPIIKDLKSWSTQEWRKNNLYPGKEMPEFFGCRRCQGSFTFQPRGNYPENLENCLLIYTYLFILFIYLYTDCLSPSGSGMLLILKKNNFFLKLQKKNKRQERKCEQPKDNAKLKRSLFGSSILSSMLK